MRRTEEQWDNLANKILRGDVDLEVLNDNTDVSGLQAELATLRAENERLREALNLTLEHAHLHLPHLRPGFTVYDIAKEALA